MKEKNNTSKTDQYLSNLDQCIVRHAMAISDIAKGEYTDARYNLEKWYESGKKALELKPPYPLDEDTEQNAAWYLPTEDDTVDKMLRSLIAGHEKSKETVERSKSFHIN